MAAADWRGKVHLMEMAGTNEIGTIQSGDVRGGALAFTPDGKWLATGSDSQVIQIWDVATRQRIRQLRGHQGKIMRLAFTPDGRMLASADTDGDVRLWNPAHPTGDLQITNDITGWGGIPPQFSPDGKWLGICTNLRDSLLVDAASLQATAAIDGWIISFSPDARELATVSSDLKLHVRRIGASSNRASIYLDTIPTRFSPQQISPDGTVVALGKVEDLRYRMKLFEAVTGESIFSPQGSPSGNITSHFLADGRSVICTDGSKINIWDMQSHTNTRSFECAAEVYFFAVSPNEETLAASHPDGTISLWDLPSGTRVGILVGHKANVFSLAFSSDGRTLASGSEDRTIKLWHLATQRELASFAEESGVYWLTFSPDNQMLVSGGNGSYQFRRAPRDDAAVPPSLPKLSMSDLPTNSIWRVPDGSDQVPPRMVAEQDECFTNMLKIYSAIMAYRQDHQQMPDWLSDLVPKYLSDTNCLICPVCARTGRKPNLNGMEDPKLPCSYCYEFSAHTNEWADYYGVASPGDTMKAWKEKQLLRYGTIVPVVRCRMHLHPLDITFAGERRVDSEQDWEKAAVQALKLKQGAGTNAVPAPR
jgi:WD40 repeat protein